MYGMNYHHTHKYTQTHTTAPTNTHTHCTHKYTHTHHHTHKYTHTDTPPHSQIHTHTPTTTLTNTHTHTTTLTNTHTHHNTHKYTHTHTTTLTNTHTPHSKIHTHKTWNNCYRHLYKPCNYKSILFHEIWSWVCRTVLFLKCDVDGIAVILASCYILDSPSPWRPTLKVHTHGIQVAACL